MSRSINKDDKSIISQLVRASFFKDEDGQISFAHEIAEKFYKKRDGGLSEHLIWHRSRIVQLLQSEAIEAHALARKLARCQENNRCLSVLCLYCEAAAKANFRACCRALGHEVAQAIAPTLTEN